MRRHNADDADDALQHRVVVLGEQHARHGVQRGEDVARAGGVLAALQARAELAVGLEQVDVVAAHEGLRHADDGGGQAALGVVVPVEFNCDDDDDDDESQESAPPRK